MLKDEINSIFHCSPLSPKNDDYYNNDLPVRVANNNKKKNKKREDKDGYSSASKSLELNDFGVNPSMPI